MPRPLGAAQSVGCPKRRTDCGKNRTYGLPDFTLDKWKAFMNAKKRFDELCGCNIYTFLPNVLENSSVNLI